MSRNFAHLSFDVDFRALERQLDDVARKALPRAAAGWLNGVAFEARQQLTKHVPEAFDGHVKFTERGFDVERAKPGDRDRMYAAVKVRPQQAAYLAFQIFGGTRTASDAGASGPRDVFVGARRTDRAGNIPKGAIKRFSARNRAEKQERKQLRQRRDAMRAAGQSTRPAMWLTAQRGRPGVFFGEINGAKGYWERPRRTRAKGKRMKGATTVVNRSAPKRLISVADRATYKPRFMYDAQIVKAMRAKGTRQAFGSELARAMRRR